MTLIVASLFLPYSIEFEVEKQEEQPTRPKLVSRQSSSLSVPRPVHPSKTPTLSSIFPALIARANNTTPVPAALSRAPGTESGDEQFFYNHKSQTVTPKSIQPTSKANMLVKASIVDGKKWTNEVLGLPSLRVSRSSSSTQTPTLGQIAKTLSASQVTTSLAELSLGNGRTKTNTNYREWNAAHTIEDIEDELPASEKSKLAPYGGFSKPDIQASLHSQNVFESAPFTVVPFRKGNGSLKNAVKLSAEHGVIDRCRWVGTIGIPCDEIPDAKKSAIAAELSANWGSEVAFVSDTTFLGHYRSFCKQILWPTLHYQIPDNPKSKAFEEHSWEHYCALNQAIADKIVETYKSEDDIVWVNDYHLLLVPQMVREKLPGAKIGFFLHVSFPSSEVFRCFAQRKRLLAGMLGADSIAFQTSEYVRHFLQTCNRLLLADVSANGISYDSRLISVEAIPVGIDASALRAQLAMPEVREFRDLVAERWHGKRLIVSRDMFDRIRGLKQKLLAYERFLNTYPGYAETTVLIQICLKGAGDEELESEIMPIIDRINGLTTSFADSQPVVFLNQDIDFAQYLALLCEADTFAVTSMREGMNLTCHEFIVATEKHSPLILSEFTGSASVLEDSALLVNPWDMHEVSEAFLHALTMPAGEKAERWASAYEVVVNTNSQVWVETCLLAVVDAWIEQQVRSSCNVKFLTAGDYAEFCKPALQRLFLLDFVSSTVTVVKGDKLVSNQTQRMIQVLNELLADPLNTVYVISYYKKSVLERMYRRLPQLGLVAENGGYVKFGGTDEWVAIVDESSLSWMDPVIKVINSMVVRLPGSYLEVEDCTVRFNLAKSMEDDTERANLVIGDCITYVNDFFNGVDVHATCLKDVVIVQQSNLLLQALTRILHRLSSDGDCVWSSSTSLASLGSTPVPDVEYPEPLGSLFVCGPSTYIFEPAFEYFNDLESNGKARNVLSVAIGDNNGTYAKMDVKGFNDLLTILSKGLK
ncbi:glycosyltransferase family 20 protein [Babjeviella inositovora NRRL Y-12698]|uniref:Glycosyltransferase family 20 protein n=1 Tax=Babjeviella inositovora NRRL Y-12698 TaxID=984486 RepID=A0A1E3QWD2_9ASCO|nr:glycosyltransferase family 20 protein [Babjeviella inositovora NRRL Y-12698]ODQ81966.1 glycosyltransferase family 20 protein [Babjeviella inositovora NRRL Y-12698]